MGEVGTGTSSGAALGEVLGDPEDPGSLEGEERSVCLCAVVALRREAEPREAWGGARGAGRGGAARLRGGGGGAEVWEPRTSQLALVPGGE